VPSAVPKVRPPSSQADPNRRRGGLGFRHQIPFFTSWQWTLFLNTVTTWPPGKKPDRIPAHHDLPGVNLTNRQMKGTFFLSVVLIPALLAMWHRVCGGSVSAVGIRRVSRPSARVICAGRDDRGPRATISPLHVGARRRMPTRGCCCPCRWTISARSRSRRRDAPSLERDAAGAWFYHGVHTGSEGRPRAQRDAAMAARISARLRPSAERASSDIRPQDATGDYGVTTPETSILVYRPHDTQPLVHTRSRHRGGYGQPLCAGAEVLRGPIPTIRSTIGWH